MLPTDPCEGGEICCPNLWIIEALTLLWLLLPGALGGSSQFVCPPRGGGADAAGHYRVDSVLEVQVFIWATSGNSLDLQEGHKMFCKKKKSAVIDSVI